MPSEPTAEPRRAAAYRFQRLSTALFLQDLGFSSTDAVPGSRVDDVTLERLDGAPVRLGEVMSGKPMLLVFGSVSCPMTHASSAGLRRLHDEFGDVVTFVTLNVREAHPGEHLEQPQTLNAKRSHARRLAQVSPAPWETLVDPLEGPLHRRLAPKPNAAFLLAPDRTILFRALWAGDERGLRAALLAARAGRPPPRPQSTAAFRPLLEGLGYFSPSLARSGPRARRELLVAAPPVALLAWLAALFPNRAPHRRGHFAVALALGLGALVTLLGWALLREASSRVYSPITSSAPLVVLDQVVT